METDSNMTEPTEFDSKSFLESIDELKTTLEPAVSCSDDLKLQELIEAVKGGNKELANFQLFSLYAQVQIEDFSENLDAAVRCIDKLLDSLNPKLGGSTSAGSAEGVRLTRGKYHEGGTSGRYGNCLYVIAQWRVNPLDVRLTTAYSAGLIFTNVSVFEFGFHGFGYKKELPYYYNYYCYYYCQLFAPIVFCKS